MFSDTYMLQLTNYKVNFPFQLDTLSELFSSYMFIKLLLEKKKKKKGMKSMFF